MKMDNGMMTAVAVAATIIACVSKLRQKEESRLRFSGK